MEKYRECLLYTDGDISWSDLDPTDICPKWPGLSEQLLFDIFCVKKGHNFVFQQRAKYEYTDFIEEVQRADRHCLKHIGILKCVEKESFKEKVTKISFHPRWLIEDDMFSTMHWMFGFTIFVRDLKRELIDQQRVCVPKIRCHIVPKRVVSTYERHTNLKANFWPTRLFKNTIRRLKHESNFTVQTLQCGKMLTALEISKLIHDLHRKHVSMAKSVTDILIVVDRQNWSQNEIGIENLYIFDHKAFGLLSLLSEALGTLDDLLWFGFEFEMSFVVKCWLYFGKGQRVRFYPEFLVSLIPSLFVTPRNLSAAEYLKKIYDEGFKHQRAVHLDDATFNLYYKAITGDDHISINYYRNNVNSDGGIKQTLGFLEYLYRRMNRQYFRSLYPMLMKDDMDSDAIFYDLLETELDGRVFIDEGDCNLMAVLDPESTLQLKSAVFQWKNIKCGSANDKALDLRDCHHFNTVIKYLSLFQTYGHNVDASNLWEFNLNEIIESFDHITSAHDLLTPERRAEVQRYLSMHVVCEEGSECDVLRKHANRRRESDQRTNVKATRDVDRVQRECVVVNEILYSVHSLLLHRDYVLRDAFEMCRSMTTNKKKMKRKRKSLLGIHQMLLILVSVCCDGYLLRRGLTSSHSGKKSQKILTAQLPRRCSNDF